MMNMMIRGRNVRSSRDADKYEMAEEDHKVVGGGWWGLEGETTIPLEMGWWGLELETTIPLERGGGALEGVVICSLPSNWEG